MTDKAKERSAFCTRRGLFFFTRMPFRLSGAPVFFCRFMLVVLRDMLWKICLCYMDDIIVFAKIPQEPLDRLHQVFTRLAEVGLKVKPSKTVWFKTEIEFLGHLVTAQGVSPMPDKLQAIRDWLMPNCLRDVRITFLDLRPIADVLFATLQPLLNR